MIIQKIFTVLSVVSMLHAVCVSATAGGVDVIAVDGSVFAAETIAGTNAVLEAHPRASSGLLVCLEPGASVEMTPGIEGSGKLFIQAMSLSRAAVVSFAVNSGTNWFDYKISSSSGWTAGADVSLKPSDKLVFSQAPDSDAAVFIDRLFFTTNERAVVFGGGRRNDLTAWDSGFIQVRESHTENLVVNGGFETPFGGEWSPAWFSAFFLPNAARLKHGEGRSDRFLRVPLDRYTSRHNEITVASGMIGTRSDREYVFTCMLRGKGICSVSLPGDMPSVQPSKTDMGLTDMIEPVRVQLSGEWRMVVTNFQGGGNLIVQFAGAQGESGDGSYMDIDNVAIYESSHSEIPLAQLEAGLDLPDPARIFDKDMPLKSALVAMFGQELDAEIAVRCFDVFGDGIAEKTVSISGGPGETVELPLDLGWIDENPCGAYRIELWHGDTFLKEHSFSVLPGPLARDKSTGFFGAYCAGSREVVPVLKQLGITSVGTQNMASDISMLRTVFPAPDKDVVVNTGYTKLFHESGIEVVSTFLGKPNWLAASPDDAELGSFSAKVTQWVNAYEGAVDAVLGWMELRQVDNPDLFRKLSLAVLEGFSASDRAPAFMLGCGTPEQARVFAGMLPDSLTGIAAQMRGWTDSDFELFSALREETGLKLWDMESRVWRQSFYRQRPAHNSFRRTEFAVMSPAWACGDVVKSLVRGRSMGGMERFMYYYMGPGSTWFGWLHYNSMTLTDYDGSIHPVGVALAYLTSRLDGAEYAGRVHAVHDGVQMHVFSNPHGSTAALWCDEVVAVSFSVSVDSAYTARDITGRPLSVGQVALSRVPVLITSSSLTAQELAGLCVSALSLPVRREPEYFFDDDTMFLRIKGVDRVLARPVAAESAWMESEWDAPLSREWRKYDDGRVPVADLIVPAVTRRFAELKGPDDELRQVPLTVLVSHKDNSIHTEALDKITLNGRTHESSSSRGRPSSFFDTGVFVRSTYTADTLTLVFRITDNKIRVLSENHNEGDALLLYLADRDEPLVVQPSSVASDDAAPGEEHVVELESGIIALLARTRWGWRASITVPAAVFGKSGFIENENLPFAFEYRDADDTGVQQRTLRWGMTDFNEKRDAGVIVCR